MDKNGYRLVWSDEFDGRKINTDFWKYDIGYTNEKAYYTDTEKNARTENSCLVLECFKETEGDRPFTSASINTRGKFSFKYGIAEMRAKLPKGQGMWPAFWMMAENWPAYGEIDIMEMIGGGKGRDDTSYGTIHWSEKKGEPLTNSGAHSFSLPHGYFNDDFHVIGIEWTEEKITWYIDNNDYFSFPINKKGMDSFHTPYYIILNLAVGGEWPGMPDETTEFPNRFEVDYVRVYQK